MYELKYIRQIQNYENTIIHPDFYIKYYIYDFYITPKNLS